MDRPRAIPFIVPVDSGHGSDEATFRVTQEAIDFLSTIDHPVAPIAVVGKYRTGKSFLLNRLIQAPRSTGGFEVGPTIEACTRGIWIWSEPTEMVLPDGLRVSVLFMDTEGMGGYGATAEHDARIFALSVLLSSLIIYNSTGAVDEEAIQSLAFVANLTKHIQLQASGGNPSGGNDDTQSIASSARHLAEGVGGSFASDSDVDSDEDDDGGYATNVRRVAGVAAGRAAAKPASAAPPLHSSRAGRLPTAGGGGGGGDGASVASGGSWRSSAAPRALAGLGPAAAPHQQRPSPSDASPSSPPSDFFPSFLWVLRDFALELSDELGEPLSPKDYLESCLAASAEGGSFSSDAQARNRVRRVLTTFFKERDCVTLVRPVDDEATLQRVDSLPDRDLRPRFRRELKALRRRVLGELVKPKTLGGERVTGRLLAGLAQSYVSALNARGVPSIGDAWGGVTRVECERACEEAARGFATALEAAAGPARLPLDEARLREAFDECAAAASAAYEGRGVGPAAPKYRADLAGRVSEHWGTLQAANAAASESACARLIARLWAAHIEPKLTGGAPASAAASSAPASGEAAEAPKQPGKKGGEKAARRRPSAAAPAAPAPTGVAATEGGFAYRDSDAFTADLGALKTAYFASARGPAVHRCLADYLLAALPPLVRAVHSGARGEAEGRLRPLQVALDAARVEAAEASARAVALEAEVGRIREERSATTLAGAGATSRAAGAESRAVALQARVKELEREVARLTTTAAAGGARGAKGAQSTVTAGAVGSEPVSAPAPTASAAAAAGTPATAIGAGPVSARRRPSRAAAGALDDGASGATTVPQGSGKPPRRKSAAGGKGAAAVASNDDDDDDDDDDDPFHRPPKPSHKRGASGASGVTASSIANSVSARRLPPRDDDRGARPSRGGSKGGASRAGSAAQRDSDDSDAGEHEVTGSGLRPRDTRGSRRSNSLPVEFPEPVPSGGAGCGPGAGRGGGGCVVQ